MNLRIAFILAGAAALSSCGLNRAYVERQYAKMSDAQLITAHAQASDPLAAATSKQDELAVAEMKRRGLIGPGRDGVPPRLKTSP